MSHHVATGVAYGEYVEILSVNEGIALVEFTFGKRADVEYRWIEGVWPLSRTLDNFDELVHEFDADTVTNMIKIMTGTPEWANRVADVWHDLY